jgi:hypothetical protein
MTDAKPMVNADSQVCPTCSSEYTHIEQVFVSARREDQVSNEITVNALSGQVRTHRQDPSPAREIVGRGRRQRISVAGHCEEGHRFALVFTQHKGVTYVEWAEGDLPDWPTDNTL